MKNPQLKASANNGKGVIEIYDVIGPSWAGMIDSKSVASAINGMGDVSEIEVRINSPGGSAFEGLGIYNILKQHSATINVRIDGIAASAASLIAMAGDSIRMPKNAFQMIHEPSTIAFGTADDLLATAERLEKLRQSCVSIYQDKTGATEDEISEWLKAETYFSGTEAKEHGFADVLTDEVKIEPAESPEMQERFGFRNAPANFHHLVALCGRPPEPQQRETPEVTEPTTPTEPQNAITEADLETAKQEAAKEAAAAEMKRQSDIRALCQSAKMEGKADAYCADLSITVEDVREQLFDAMCKANVAPDSGAGDQDEKTDPDQAYKDEYQASKESLAELNISEEDYVKSRRIDDGVDTLKMAEAA